MYILLALFIFLPHISSIDTSLCGKSKDCLFAPPGCVLDQCTYFLSLSTFEGWTTFELVTSNITKGSNYLALGMSDDELMGEEPVSFCFFLQSGSTTVNIAYNNGKSNTVADDSMKTIINENIQLIHAQKNESTLLCSFRQKIKPSTEHSFLAHLNNKFTLFIVRGKASSPQRLGIHNLSPSSPDFPFISPSSINLTHMFPISNITHSTSAEDVSSTTPLPSSTNLFDFSMESRLWMIRIHGILMVVPWLSLIPSAILSARYLRSEWTSFSPGGINIWFHIHRTFNFVSLILLIISTLLVLTAKDFKWKGPWWNKLPGKSTSPGAIHSLIGAISLLATLLQFLSALIRPSPHSKARPYFNAIHRAIGAISLLFALIATLLASNFFLKYWSDPSRAFYLTIIASLIIILFFILFQVERKSSSKKIKSEEIDMSNGNTSVQTETTKESLMRKIMFISFFILSTAISIYIALHLIM